jgi:hypothetical protein
VEGEVDVAWFEEEDGSIMGLQFDSEARVKRSAMQTVVVAWCSSARWLWCSKGDSVGLA